MIESKTNINLLKIKKCAKEYFNFYSLYNFNIKDLYLFDTLEYYCNINNFNYYKIIENILKLISYSDITENICLK